MFNENEYIDRVITLNCQTHEKSPKTVLRDYIQAMRYERFDGGDDFGHHKHKPSHIMYEIDHVTTLHALFELELPWRDRKYSLGNSTQPMRVSAAAGNGTCD